MLVCYLDDSGNGEEPIITMAGHLSLTEEWELFEQKAHAYLAEHNVSHLHTVDLHRAEGEFERWPRNQRDDFIRGLYAILAPHCGRSVEFSVLKSVFMARQKQYDRKVADSPFGFCFRGLVNRLVKDDGVREMLDVPDINLSFIAESGHRNNGDVQRIFKRHQEHPKGQIFKSLTFADKKSFIALQMADFVAYYSRRIRVGPAAKRKADLEYFNSVISEIRHLPFIATDFGWDPIPLPDRSKHT